MAADEGLLPQPPRVVIMASLEPLATARVASHGGAKGSEGERLMVGIPRDVARALKLRRGDTLEFYGATRRGGEFVVVVRRGEEVE